MILILTQILTGIIVLVYAADQLVLAARRIAYHWHIPSWLIGLTVVALGTSLPEFVVNVVSITSGHPDLAVGTVVGSNIVNVLLIIGILICIRPAVLSIKRYSELVFMVIVGFVSAFLLWSGQLLSRADSLLLLVIFAVYSAYLFWFSDALENQNEEVMTSSIWKSFVRLFFSVIALGIAGNVTTDASVALATKLGLSQAVISLTILAWGTSLPELVTSSVAAWRNQTGLALGNIVGSYTLNIVVIFGIVGLIQEVPYNPAFNLEVIFMLIASVWLVFAVILKRHTSLQRSLAIGFLGLFAIYCGLLLK